MKTIKVKTPAKINLTLEILKKRQDGYHNIKSVMQAVSLYDFITITVESHTNKANLIKILGNSPIIPYDKSNLAYISAEKFLNKAEISNKEINIYIEKYIPVAAGLAGGSSNAAGVLLGLNEIFENILNFESISDLASQIGADVSFCLNGGTQLTTSKGEKLEKLSPTPLLDIIIVKPVNLFISAKEAYNKYSLLDKKPETHFTESMILAIKRNNPEKIAKLLTNNLESAILKDYPEITDIKNFLLKNGCLNALMSGSGPSVYGIYNTNFIFPKKSCIEIYKATTINHGVITKHTHLE